MNRDYNVILTKQLQKFRKDRHYTHQYIADYLQVSRAAYTNYENAVRLPDVFTLDKLARLYNVSIEAFLYPPELYNTFKEFHDLPYESGKIPDIEFSSDELQLIYNYRHLNEVEKEELVHISEYKVEKCS